MTELYEPCYSGYLVHPFLTVVRRYPGFPVIDIDSLYAKGPQSRIPIAVAHELLRGALTLAGDQDLGLKAAQSTSLGFFDTLEFAAAYAPTYRNSFNTFIKFAPLLNEAAAFRLDIVRERAVLTLATRVPMSRSAGDFCVGAFFTSAMRWHGGAPPETEIRFAHTRPDDISEYRSTFPGCTLVFDAPDYAIVADANILDVQNPHAMPRLHSILLDHGQSLLSRLPKFGSIRDSVREAILATMNDGTVSAESVASRLSMSRRSLSRHLGTEGTTFRDLLETERARAAKHYLESTNLNASEISARLGFSQPAAFARAFQRWAHCAPSEYRRRLRP